MSFTNLSVGLQDIINYNYDTFIKTFMLFFMLGFSVFYLFYYKSHVEKPTPFLAVGIVRVIASAFSFSLLVLSPLALLLLAPQVEASSFYKITVYPYLSLMVLWLFIILVDMIHYLPLLLLRVAGLNKTDKNVNKVYNWLKQRGIKA